jgi:glycine betaine/proline transport system substrate-binding protein
MQGAIGPRRDAVLPRTPPRALSHTTPRSKDLRQGYRYKVMRATALLGLFLLIVLALATGCSSSGDGGSAKTLDIADIGWTENTAVSALTQVLFEDQLGYQQVTVHTEDLDSVYDAVAQGDLSAFQDVWLPNQRDLLESAGDNVELLGFWYQGQTKQGIAVPSYMNTTTLEQLNDSKADMILGIEPSSVVMDRASDEVIPQYGLHQELVEGPTAGMLAEVDKLYSARQEFAFLAWSPHWMNQQYDIRYLEDPKNAFGDLNDAAKIATVVNKGLKDRDPMAYAFMGALTFNEDQLSDLESTINKEGDPRQGARVWEESNREVWQPWVEAAWNAQKA